LLRLKRNRSIGPISLQSNTQRNQPFSHVNFHDKDNALISWTQPRYEPLATSTLLVVFVF
jgi:hypothetical protein